MNKKQQDFYDFYWLNELGFQKLLESVTNEGKEYKINIIGYVIENNLNENNAVIKYDNSILKLDLSRVSKQYKISKLPYCIYGCLKRKNNESILFIDFFRMLNEGFDFDNYRSIIENIRDIRIECENFS